MKILCLSRKDIKHPKAWGAEVVIHQYLSWLASMWHEIVQISTWFVGSEKYTSIDWVQIHRRSSIHSIYFIFWAIYLRTYRNQYDIIIDHAWGIPLFSPLYIWHKPIIFFTHHVGTKERAEYFSQWIGMWWVGTMCRWIYNTIILWLYHHKPTITVSQWTASELIKLWFSQVIVLPNTSNYPRVDHVGKRWLELTVVGRVVPNKQFSHAIEVIHQLHQHWLQYRLNIIWIEQDPLESKKLHDLVIHYHLADYITFYGRLSSDELLTIWDRTQYGLMVSDKEWFGMTVLEANSRWVPVIWYNIPWVNEVIHDSINGYLIQKNNINQIVDCIIKQDNYDNLVYSTIQFIQEYPTWDINTHALDTIISHETR